MSAALKHYDVGNVLHLTLTSEGEGASSVAAKILELREPFTLSCVMIVEIDPSADSKSTRSASKAVLKLYDRRFATQLRKDESVDNWTAENEAKFVQLVASGEAAAFVRKLREEDDFEEPDDGWSDAENEAYLRDMCSDLFATETRAYGVLESLQGKQIPKLYSTVTLPVDIGTHADQPEAEAQEFLTIPGILLEYVVGPTVSTWRMSSPERAGSPSSTRPWTLCVSTRTLESSIKTSDVRTSSSTKQFQMAMSTES